MTLAERLRELVRAAFSGIYVHSFEHEDAIPRSPGSAASEGWSLATWDVDRGLRPGRPAADADGGRAGGRPAGRDPRRSAPWPRPTARRCWCSGTSTAS